MRTFELFTWYHDKMDGDDVLNIAIKEIIGDSPHLDAYPSSMKIPPTPEELSESKARQEELLRYYKHKYEQER